MRHDRAIHIPVEVLQNAMLFMPESVFLMIEQSLVLWSEGKMLAADFDALLRSVAWQSPTLRRYYEDPPDPHEEGETLSEEDFMLLHGQSA